MELLDEIKQSGAAMKKLADYMSSPEGKETASQFCRLIAHNGYKKFIFTGMGSSHCAAFPACQYLHTKGIDARAIESGELLLYGLPADALIIAISQSGHSEEVIALLEKGIAEKSAVTVTNYEGNRMYELGCMTFPICAGVETKSSSKSYTNTLGLLMYIAYLIAGEDTAELTGALKMYASDIEGAIEAAQGELDAVHEFLGDTSYLPIIAGGPSYATACQAEILIMEISRVCSARFTPGEFMHGTVELLSPDFRGIVLNYQPQSFEGVKSVVRETQAMGGKLWVIGDQCGDLGECAHVSPLPQKSIAQYRLLSPIIEILPIILYTDYIAKKKGLSAGTLRTVQK